MNARGGVIQEQMRENAPTRRYVYFLRAIGLGLVKIGSSVRPDRRLSDYSLWSPVPLALIAMIEGDHRLEARFHTLFKNDHSHAEWFRDSARMEAVIAAIRAGDFDIAALPTVVVQQISVSDAGRENRRLRVLLTKRFAVDYRLPPHIKSLYDGLSLPAGPERERTVEAVQRLLSEAA